MLPAAEIQQSRKWEDRRQSTVKIVKESDRGLIRRTIPSFIWCDEETHEKSQSRWPI